MAEIGERLREARMGQRVDISEVEDATKIRAKYLRAIENEEFDLLPGPTFAKSFLRTYAEYLGLDARLLVEEYRVQHEPAPEEETQHFPPAPPRRPRRPQVHDRGAPGLPWILGGAVVLLLTVFMVIGLIAGDGEEGGSEGRPPSDARREAGDGDGERRPGRERRRRRGRAATPRAVTMRIAPTVATYVCVDAGPGEVIYEGPLTRPRTFRGRRLRLNLGKTSAAVRVNGRPVDLGGGPNPVGFAFSPGARPRPLPLGQRPCA